MQLGIDFCWRIARRGGLFAADTDFMIKAAIFDVDGTLVDSVDLHARAWQDTFREFGKNVPFHEIRMQIGKGGDQLMPVFLSKAELENCEDQISKRRKEIFKQKYLADVHGFPRVRDLFQRVLVMGRRLRLPHQPPARSSKHIRKLRTSRICSTRKRRPMMPSNQSHILISFWLHLNN